MVDNITLNSGSGGATLRTDDDGTAHWQYVKLAWGADNTQTIVTTGNPIPVDLRTDNLSGNMDVNIAASGATVTVSGTVTANAGTGTMTVTDDGSFTLAANSGVDIGDVDVTSVTPGTAAGNLGKAVDAAAGASDTGIASLAVRDDALTTLTPIDGDYVRLRTGSTGALWVQHSGDITIADGGNSITVDGSVTLGSNSGVDIGDVDVASVVPGTAAGNLGKADNAAYMGGDVGVSALVVRRDADTTFAVADGDYVPLQVDANGRLKVEAFDGGDTFTVDQATASNFNAQVVGNVAHDAADSGNTVKVGGVARTAHPTAAAAGDRVDFYCDDLGRMVTTPFVPRDRVVHNRIALTSTSETTLIAAGGAGVFRDIVYLVCSNESATEVRIDIKDATAGTNRISIDLAADGGGAVMPLPIPLTQAAANNNWTATLSSAVSTVYITAIAVEAN